MISNLTVVVYSYPTPDDPVYAFIRPVICGLADLGIHITVLSPQSITNAYKRKVRLRPLKWIDHTVKGRSIEIIQPRYLSFSMIRFKGELLSRILFDKAVRKAFVRMKSGTDMVYAHFWESGVAAAKAIRDNHIPLVIACGENHLTVRDNYPDEQVEKCKEMVKGVICVSSKNMNECHSLDLITNTMKTAVLPNAIDNLVFKKADKIEARKALNFPEDEIIAAFVGEFTERKGVKRVVEAAKKNPNLKLVLIGNGKINKDNEQILFCGMVPHERVALYLNASDFFVLPTLAEGCCNAIVEAMACGLPIISSDLPFNYDILNKDNSILVDPNDIEQISDAIIKLTNDSALREQLSNGSLKASVDLTIETRVLKIREFLDSLQN